MNIAIKLSLLVFISSQVHCQIRSLAETGTQNNGTNSVQMDDLILPAVKPKINALEILTGMSRAIQLLLNQNRPEPVYTGDQLALASGESRENYREQAEHLRKEIAKRAGQLQNVVTAAIDVLKERGDVVVRRILENLNTRLDQAKKRADKILKEPRTSEMAIKTLNTINQGLSSLNQLIQQTLRRVNISINVDLNKDGKQDQEKVKLNETIKYEKS